VSRPAPAEVFKATPTANRNRAEKILTIEDWCRARRIGPREVIAWDEALRRKVARAAKVNPPSQGSPDWDLIIEHLGRGVR